MTTQQTDKPIVALTLGDATGIGSELVAKLLNLPQITHKAHTVVIGDEWQWQQGQKIANTNINLIKIDRLSDAKNHHAPMFLSVNTLDESAVNFAEESALAGASVLKILEFCMNKAIAGEIDAICFAPLNKFAMKKGGLQYEDELHFFANHLGVDTYFCEFNTLGNLWTSRISSHIPLKDAYQYLTQDRIIDASTLIYKQLKQAGFDNPKVAVAAFNPHAGENGTCGREEIDVIIPAVQKCSDLGYPILGPYPADTIFIKAQKGEIDAVVTMYHDQGQIAIKLMGFSRGVTVQGGLPIPITTPAHGTAFDIAGKGLADVTPMKNAFELAVTLGNNLEHRTGTVFSAV